MPVNKQARYSLVSVSNMAAQQSTCEYDSYNAFVVEQAIVSIEDILQQNNSKFVGLSISSFVKPIDWTTKHCLLTNNGCTSDLVCDNNHS